LGQIKLSEIERATILRIVRPAVEIAAIRRVAVDQSGQERPVTPQARIITSASAGRRPGRISRRTPGTGMREGLTSANGVSRDEMRIFDGATAANRRRRSSSSGRIAAQGSRLPI
jgi:hypothetical protein